MDNDEKSDEDKLREWFRIHPNPDWVPAKPWDSSVTDKLKDWFRTSPNPDVAPPSTEEDEESGEGSRER